MNQLRRRSLISFEAVTYGTGDLSCEHARDTGKSFANYSRRNACFQRLSSSHDNVGPFRLCRLMIQGSPDPWRATGIERVHSGGRDMCTFRNLNCNVASHISSPVNAIKYKALNFAVPSAAGIKCHMYSTWSWGRLRRNDSPVCCAEQRNLYISTEKEKERCT